MRHARYRLVIKSVHNLLFILIILYFFLSASFLFRFCEAVESEAALAIDVAEETVALAYQDVIEAERSGADVSNISIQLNEAARLLAQAKIYYRVKDYDQAINFATSCERSTDEVRNISIDLKISAEMNNIQRNKLKIIFTVIGVAFIISGSLLCWQIFKKHYIRQILKMKPEVESSEV